VSWSGTRQTTPFPEVSAVLLLVLIAAIAAVVCGLISIAFGHTRRFNDVERFHRARSITTEWSRRAVTGPVVEQRRRPDRERESVDA
jgi:hypothetical protein